MTKPILFGALSVLFSTQVFAGAQDNLFGEVSLGYDTSSIAATNVVAPNENGTSTGFAAEARGGYMLGPLLAGVSVAGTAGYLSYTNTLVKNGYWNKTFTYGLLGLDFGVLRLWGEYGVVNQMRLALDYGSFVTDKIYTGGVCWKAGVSVALSKRIHLNAEYYSNKPDTLATRTGLGPMTNTYGKWEETGYMFSLAYDFFGSEIKQR